MLKNSSLLLVLCLLISCTKPLLRPESNSLEIIFQSDRMQNFIDEIEKQIAAKKRLSIVFDIDDTILAAEGSLGTPPWFYTMVDAFRKKGYERSEAYALMGAIDRKVQAHSKVKLIENETLRAIQRWRQQGVVVLALTSRPELLKSVTDHQFKKLDIQFSHPTFLCVEKQWPKGRGLFSEGVIYVGPDFTKEEIFDQFLEILHRCGENTEIIAHSDDQEKYVTEIRNSAIKRKLGFIGQIYKKAINERRFTLKEAQEELRVVLSKDKDLIPKELQALFFEQAL